MKRLSAEGRRACILEVMAGMAARARHRGDFTAVKVAMACGVSTTLLYRMASAEFRGYRAGLPGEPATDGVVAALRSSLLDANHELERLRRLEREHRSCPAASDIEIVIRVNEDLEVENRSLRAQLEHLRRRAETGSIRPLDSELRS